LYAFSQAFSTSSGGFRISLIASNDNSPTKGYYSGFTPALTWLLATRFNRFVYFFYILYINGLIASIAWPKKQYETGNGISI
jgi:hypothetical protein